MPVNSPHPSHSAYMIMWTKCRDTLAGSEVIKAKGAEYLPMLSGQETTEYNAYKARALFYGITGKTVSGLVGMSIAIPPTIKAPKDMLPMFEGTRGLRFIELWATTLSELLTVGRFGILMDAPVGGGDPFASTYPTESIINWLEGPDGSLVYVVLYESFYAPSVNDKYLRVLTIQYRVLEIIQGKYTVTVYSDKLEVITPTYTPLFSGKPLEAIPFRCANPSGFGFEPVKPPMLDIVNINISHYMSSADLEHGRHFTGLPTPVAIGVDADSSLHIGSTQAWVLPPVGADAKFLEFTGQGLASLEKALVEKQSQLASMSARLIDNSSKGSENADIVRLRYSSEAATLSGIVDVCSALLNWVYAITAIMLRENPDEVEIKLSTDFVSGRLSTKEIAELTESYISGGISAETLVFNLRRGQVYSLDHDDTKEIEDLKENKKAQLKEKTDVKVQNQKS